jgi:hypothetical protein
MAKSFAYRFFRRNLFNLGIGIGPPLTWLYNTVQRLRGGVPWPSIDGRLPTGARTPSATLDLQPGEWVRVKELDAILATCQKWKAKNRGLSFDPEMVPYCGGTYRVLRRVTKVIDQRTGKTHEIKNPCIVLDGVVCQARYSQCRLFCPRSIHPYWREIWLERVPLNFDSGSQHSEDYFPHDDHSSGHSSGSHGVSMSNSLVQIRNL